MFARDEERIGPGKRNSGIATQYPNPSFIDTKFFTHGVPTNTYFIST
jgi:hypothetical protein